MKKRHYAFLSFFLAALMLAIGYGCSGAADGGPNISGSSAGGPATGTGGNTGSGGAGQGGCFINCDSTGFGGSTVGTIVIAPANPTLAIVDGNVPTQAFTATFNGQDVTANVVWLYERPDIGDITAGSTFTPTGIVAGTGKLSAAYNGAEGSTTVSVSIKKTVDGVGLTPQQIAAFDAPTGGPDNAISLVYPFDKTVFPLGVLSPEVQWNGGLAGDIYRIRLVEKYYDYTEYFMAPPPSRHPLVEADWQAVESSGTGAKSDPLAFALQRFSGGVAYEAKTQTWHIAQGRLRGSVYYWELPDVCGNASTGRVLRIKADSTQVDEFYPTGQCFGCHTVSRDGKTMFATFDSGSPFPHATLDLSQSPAVIGNIQLGQGVAGTFGAFNDKGDRIVVSTDAASGPSSVLLQIMDANNGQVLNAGAMQQGCGEPAWSPDGKKMAAICQLGGGGWVFDATAGSLAVADVAPDGVTVSNTNIIVPQAGGQGRPAYPSFSPGSEWIAFGRPTQGSRSTGQGDLWLVAPDGSNLKQLAAASGDNRAFNPVFAPLRAGGYFWLIYITRQDYGNTLVSTNRQQLWVTAIDDPPTVGDPSHPPFYMRGQENCGKSENAYMALDPCKEVGQGCTSGVDCCNGQCIKDPNTNMYVCGEPPPPGECSENGNACETSADCCDYPVAECIDGFCQVPPPT